MVVSQEQLGGLQLAPSSNLLPKNDDKPLETPAWKVQAAQKRLVQFESIPTDWRLSPDIVPPLNAYTFLQSASHLTDKELAITNITDARTLLKKLANRQWSAIEVVRAFSKRAAIAQQLTGCCTEFLFEAAWQHAQILDDHLERTGRVVGPLHGLPISLKDIFDVQGYDSTVGWVALINRPAETHSDLTHILIKQGAIPFVKTNISQALMLSDSYNHVFKQSLNSLNRNLISGGSSGGEGALVGCRGSILGFGTDTGGSIRIPANLQGLYGLCPSVGRVPFTESKKWELIAPPVAGPLATSLSTIETLMTGLLSAAPWDLDPSLIPIPWRTELAAKPNRPLRLGYFIDDGVVRVQPPIKKAIRTVIDHLRSAGHEVIEWDTTTHGAAYKEWLKAVFGDGGADCRRLAEQSGEPLVEGVLIGTENDRLTISEAAELAASRARYQRYYQQRWLDSAIDALITPVQPYVGMKPRMWAKSNPYIGYTSHWNWLGYAALSVPVMCASTNSPEISPELSEDLRVWQEHIPRNTSDEINHTQYDPVLIHGMPVGVQVVGGRYGEEKCISIAKVIEDVLEKKPLWD